MLLPFHLPPYYCLLSVDLFQKQWKGPFLSSSTTVLGWLKHCSEDRYFKVFTKRGRSVLNLHVHVLVLLVFFDVFVCLFFFWKLKLIPGLKKETSFLELFPKSVMGNNIDWKSIFAPDDDDGIVGYTAKASQA